MDEIAYVCSYEIINDMLFTPKPHDFKWKLNSEIVCVHAVT